MIRVLHFTSVINRSDPVDLLLRGIDRSRFEVSAVAGIRGSSGPGEPGYERRIVDFEFDRKTWRRMFSELGREIRRFRPHIVHTHHFHENLVAAARARVSRSFDLVVSRRYSDQIHLWTKGARRLVFLAAERFIQGTASRIVAPSQHVAKFLVDVEGVDSSRIATIEHGIDVESQRGEGSSTEIRKELNAETSFLMVYCGRLMWFKGLDEIFDAIANLLPGLDVRLAVLGDGPHLKKLTEKASVVNISDVVSFVGWQADPIPWLEAADVVVNPSYTEAFSKVLIEAIAVGTPVIMTPVGVAREVIGDDERGVIVPPRDSAAIADAVRRVAGDDAMRERVAREGAAFVAEHYSPRRMIASYESLYSEIGRSRGV